MTITHSFIRDFTDREAITGYYIISDIRTTLSRAGKPYLSATLTDASGHIRMICWEPDDFVSPDLNGSIVGLCGIVGIYRGELQLTVEHLEEADLSELDTEDINAVIPSAPIHVEAYSQYIYDLVQSISHPQIRAICNELLSRNWDLFSSIPAGKSVHHAFRHGLLMHTADMASLAEPLAAGNPAAINRDLLLGGVLLHDIGKLREFVLSPVTGLVTGYTDEGNLLGHSVLGAIAVGEAGARIGAGPQVIMNLQHMLLSHHGDPAAGASKVPMTIEAELLHDLDKLDSRKQICLEQLQSTPPFGYTSAVSSLDRRLYRHGITETGACVEQEDAWNAEEERWEPTYPCTEETDSSPDDEFISHVVATFPNGYQMTGDFDGEIFYPDDPNFPVL